MVGLLVGAAGPVSLVSAQEARHAPWWRSSRVQAALTLSPVQIQQIDTIYRESLPARRRLRSELASAQAQLARVIAETPFDDRRLQPLVISSVSDST